MMLIIAMRNTGRNENKVGGKKKKRLKERNQQGSCPASWVVKGGIIWWSHYSGVWMEYFAFGILKIFSYHT